MLYADYKKAGRDKVAKPKMKALSIFFGLLICLALIGGISLALIYPLFIDTSATNVIGVYYNLINELMSGKITYKFIKVAIMTVFIFITLIYLFVTMCKILSSKMPKSGNVSATFKAGLAIVFFWSTNELAWVCNLYSMGFSIFQYAITVALFIGIIYDFARAIKGEKLVQKTGKHCIMYYLLTFLACVIGICAAVMNIDVNTFAITIDVAQYHNMLKVSFVGGLVDLIPFNNFASANYIILVVEILLLLTKFSTLMFFIMTIVGAVFSLFKISVDREYVRTSRYFGKTSALKTAGRLTFSLMLLNCLSLTSQVLDNGSTARGILWTIDLYYVGMFAVVIFFVVIGWIIVARDKKKMLKEQSIASQTEVVESKETQPISKPTEAVNNDDASVQETPVQPVQQPYYQQQVMANGQFVPMQQIDGNKLPPQAIVYVPLGTQQPITVEPKVEEPVDEPIEEAEDGVKDNAPLVIERKSLEEKLRELSAPMKKFYKDIMAYAEKKEGVKRSQSVYADSISYGRDSIIKVSIRNGKIVCAFSLISSQVKSALKGAKSQSTVVRISDTATFELAKKSVDMAYDLALEAKEARHQEQLRKRREARARKNEEAKKQQ